MYVRVCVDVGMCHCLVKQVKNVSGDDPFLPQAHLGIFVAPSTFLSLFPRSVLIVQIVQGDSLECYGRPLSYVCVCMCIGEHDTTENPV